MVPDVKVFSGKISIMGCWIFPSQIPGTAELGKEQHSRNDGLLPLRSNHPCGARCVMCDVWSVLCAAGWFFTCAGRAAGGKGAFLIDSNHSAVFFLFRRFLFAARRSVATPAIANFRGPLPLKIHGCYFDRGKGEKRKMILTFLPGCL